MLSSFENLDLKGVVNSGKFCRNCWQQWLIVFLGDTILGQLIELTVRCKTFLVKFTWTACLIDYPRNSELLNNSSKLIY